MHEENQYTDLQMPHMLRDVDPVTVSQFREYFETVIAALENFADAPGKENRKAFDDAVLAIRALTDEYCPYDADRTDFYMAMMQEHGRDLLPGPEKSARLYDAFREAAHGSQKIKKPLFIEEILSSARAYQADPVNEGGRPNHDLEGLIQHGDLKGRMGWTGVESVIFSRRASPPFRYHSLADMLEAHGIFQPESWLEHVTDEQVLQSARAFRNDPVNKGRRPNLENGPITHGPLAGKGTWQQVDYAMAERRNGFEDAHYISLAMFFDYHEFYGTNAKPDFTQDDIAEAARLFKAEHGRVPRAHDGDINHGKLAGQNETWRCVYEAFLMGARGLEGCGYKTMGDFFVVRGLCGPEDVKGGPLKGSMRKPPLRLEDILAAAHAYQADPVNQGRRPSKESGLIKHGNLANEKISWTGVDHFLRLQLRGLKNTGYKSLSDLLNKNDVPKILPVVQVASNSPTNAGTLVPAGP